MADIIDCNNEDKFYLNKNAGKVTWVYYNPDSEAGGQYVHNVLYYDQILEIMGLASEPDDFFDLLGERARQSLTDVGTENFDDTDKEFKENPYDFIGCDKTVMDGLIAFAKMSEAKASPTKTFSFGQYWQVYGTNSIEVPAHFTVEQAINHVKANWGEVGLASSASYVSDSDEPDFENCGFEEE